METRQISKKSSTNLTITNYIQDHSHNFYFEEYLVESREEWEDKEQFF